MTSVFLYTFFVGFGLTLVSVILGAVDLGGDGGGADAGHLAGDLAHGGDFTAHGDLSHGGGLSHGHGVNKAIGKVSTIFPINFQTVVAALTGFGGVGYVLSSLGVPGLLIPVVGAAAGGLACAWLIFQVQRFLAKGERPLGPTSYEGIIGRLTVPIREGGTGEVVYTMHGTRQVSAARSVDGKPIAKGAEVVILRYEKGVAYVQLWRDFMKQQAE